MDKKTDKLTLNGIALSMKAVADLMTRLQSSKQFKTVDLKETSQNTGQGDVETFKFALDLVIEPPAAASAPAAAAPKPGAPKA
jgi:Tfp pilus assembly protein PilN